MQIYMPEVDAAPDQDRIFSYARQTVRQSSGRKGNSVVLLTPGRMQFIVPCPAPRSMARDHVASIEQLTPLPPKPITVIAFNDLISKVPHASTPPQQMHEQLIRTFAAAVPFFGYVVGFGYLGHNVIIFEGHPHAFEAGVRGAEILVMDGGMVPLLRPDWRQVAEQVMAGRQRVVIFGRDGQLDAFEMAGAANPTPIDEKALLEQGIQQAREEHYAEAIQALDTLLAHNPQHMIALLNRAHAHMRLKHYAAALADYERYLASPAGQQNPKRAELLERVHKLRNHLKDNH
ncbi:MAG: hypothetical protein K8J31_18155 [Anaerolineae bacterium]|nr:hypothetical protein [Anaerolineae bacterium]